MTVTTLERSLLSDFVMALRVWTVRAGMKSVKSLPSSISLRLAGQHIWSNLQDPGLGEFLPQNTMKKYHLRLTSGYHRYAHTCGCALAHLWMSFICSRVKVARRLFNGRNVHVHISALTHSAHYMPSLQLSPKKKVELGQPNNTYKICQVSPGWSVFSGLRSCASHTIITLLREQELNTTADFVGFAF